MKLIQGGMVYDGTGGPPFRGDVLIRGDRIEKVAPDLSAIPFSGERIDALGMVVAPGFIDMHRHLDAAVFRDEDFGGLELAQGITAAVMGHCGLAPVPMHPFHGEAWRAYLSPVTGEVPPLPFFASHRAYMTALRERPLSIHLGVMAAMGSIRVAVKGFDPSPFTSREREAARALVAEAMDAGALGASLGYMYQPECYTTPAEMVALLRPVAKASGLLTTHIRGEGDSLVASVEEVIAIAEEAGVPLSISHLKATGIANWHGAIHRAMERIEAARDRGMPVTADFYPYAGGSTTLTSLVPPALFGRGDGEALRRFGTRAGREEMKKAMEQKHPGWDNMALSIGWERIRIASVGLGEHRPFCGRDMADIAREMGMDNPSDLLCHLLCSEGGQVGIVVMSMSPEDVDAVAQKPYTAIISDALYGGGDNPHPRLYGAFAQAIEDFVVRRKVLSLSMAIHKMTGLPAAILGLTDHGLLRPGYAADVVVFRPEDIKAHATYARSRVLSTGMHRVMLGGETVFAAERREGPAMGRVLARQHPMNP